MNALNERLDAVAVADSYGVDTSTLVLAWLKQATAEIDLLNHQVEILQRLALDNAVKTP